MSTNTIAPNNNGANQNATSTASQTLFRFVSLRNPQLTKTDPTNLGFVYRPQIAKNGIFDQADIIDAKEGKIALLEQRLAEVLANHLAGADYFFKTEDEVKQFAEPYFNLGELIAKNEVDNLTANFPIQSDIADSSESRIGPETRLWDNLIYQVLTQEDFYVKEALMQVLKGKHYSDNFTIENKEVLKNAKVVLPSELFLDDYKNSDTTLSDRIFTVNESSISDAYIQKDPNALSNLQKEKMKVEAQKLSELHFSKLKKSVLENLKSELQNAQKSYQKSYNKAYKDAYERHQQIIAPLVAARDAELASIEAQITDATTEAQKQQLYADANITEIPVFNFSYKNEINFEDLQAKLSEDSLKIFNGVFAEQGYHEEIQKAEERPVSQLNFSDAGDFVIPISEDYQTFQSVFEKLNEEIDALSQTILSSTSVPQKQFAKIGSALVPVSTGKGATHLAYTMMANYYHYWYFSMGSLQFSFDVEDSSWSLGAAKITAQTNSGPQEETYTNIAVVDGKITLPASLSFKFTQIDTLKIELLFDNGREATLDFANVINNQVYSGVISLKPVAGSSTSPFMPKHFGVKRLGIADYLKVEQSLHAYVPGEVSNIENVMASELRHKGSTKFTSTETTDTTNKTIETEHVSDTTTATRNEMQSEVSNVMEQDRTAEAHVSMRKDTVLFGHIEAGASYASHNSQQTSTRQAVTKAQEITNRAMDRIVSKVTEERVVKIINQFTEQNTHEFDNRGNGTTTPQHIAGVYRWVDKKYKNQIYNYGKRAMFEFMVPEPAKLHRLATAGEILTEPQDPRTAKENQMKDYSVADETLLKYWAGVYGVKLVTILPNTTQVINNAARVTDVDGEFGLDSYNFLIPENYVGKNASFSCRSTRNRSSNWIGQGYYSEVFCSNLRGEMIGRTLYSDINFDESVYDINVSNNIQFNVKGHNVNDYSIKVIVNCELSAEYISKWKTDSFDAIIAAYTQAKADFDKKKADMEAQQKDQTQNFYRDMEEVVLKHNCIAYLLQDYGALGRTDITNGDTAKTMADFKVIFGDDLDKYTALAKFMEQAFEWNIMSYTFYPYYWGNKEAWKEMYTTESIDPLFRNFLQAGMARVIVTVKPGFEDAVQFFMNTGRIWNGGEVPVIGDPLYLSIVDELREPTGVAQGKAWITRIPTTLNILQAKSIGLEVQNALPISTENPADFEEPKDVETTSPFGAPKDVVLVGSERPTTLPNIIK